MAEIAIRGGTTHPHSVARAARIRRLALSDAFFRRLTQAAAIIVLFILGGVIPSISDRMTPPRMTRTFFRRLTQAAAIIVLFILGGVILSLIDGSLPAFQKFGVAF